jgi:hypothetical protein
VSPETHQVLILIGTWLAGVGTTLAAVVALYLAWRDRRVHLLVSANAKVILPPPIGRDRNERYVGIQVTNIGFRPVQVTGIGWSFGIWPFRVFLHQIPGDRAISAQVPLSLADSESGSFIIPFSSVDGEDWLESVSEALHRPRLSRINLLTLRVLVWTSHGKEIRQRPGQSLKKHLLESLRSKN